VIGALAILAVAMDCAPCHREIAGSFRVTPMANSAGRVARVEAGTYRHGPSRAFYEIEAGGNVRVRTPEASASQKLDIWIGSGAHGRSYLYLRGDRLFEAPVTWYRDRGWAASPGYENDANSDWSRPIDRACLWCHTSGAKPIHGTANRYAAPVFMHGGLSCERCHAADAKHFNNPAKLAEGAREDVCRQCHMLAGRTELPGRSFYEFRPGMRLDRLVRYQVTVQRPDSPLSTTNHFERLAESACAKASGSRLWCGTCHNPHPAGASDRNDSCRNCHGATRCGRGPDCAACHMPRNPAPDAGHSILTDHWIQR
jgi:hypothetical protein